jgi:Mu-like prophage I protein
VAIGLFRWIGRSAQSLSAISAHKDFSETDRKKLAQTGAAMPDGSFPIRNEADLKHAIQAIGRAKDPAAAKRHIVKRARALGKGDLIPDEWSKNTGIGVASHALALGLGDDGEPPEWVMVVPARDFGGADGRGPFFNSDPAGLVARTQELIAKHMTAGLPVDLDHSTDMGHGPAPAVGWMKTFEVRNGALFAKVEWNEAGEKAIRSKEWKYISPVFEFERPADAPKDQETGKVTRFLRMALTNNPNLALPAIAASQIRSGRDESEAERVARALGADESAKSRPKGKDMAFSNEEIRLIALMAKKGKPLHETVKALQDALPNVHPHQILDMAKLACDPAAMDAEDGDGGAEDADGGDDAGDDDAGAMSTEDPYASESEEQMTARHADEMARCSSDAEKSECAARHAEEKASKVRAAQAAHQRNNPSRSTSTMTKAQLDAAVAKHPLMISAQRAIGELRGERAAEKAVARVDAAIDAGKLIAGQRDWAITYCTNDSTGFEKFIGGQPTILTSGELLRAIPPGAAHPSDDELTPAELTICKNTLCPPADFLKRKKELALMLAGPQRDAGIHKFEIVRKAA